MIDTETRIGLVMRATETEEGGEVNTTIGTITVISLTIIAEVAAGEGVENFLIISVSPINKIILISTGIGTTIQGGQETTENRSYKNICFF
jgi:hypothetical protein